MTRSQAVLDSPPGVVLGGWVNGWVFTVDEDSTTIEFANSSGEHEDTSIVVPGEHLLLVETAFEADTVYLLAGALDAAERLKLYRYHDATSDGAPDASTQVLLLTSTEAMYVTDISRTDDGTTYMLDLRCQDVLVATDTNADDWPDQVVSTPFARSADFPKLLHTNAIRFTSSGKLLAMVDRQMEALHLPHDIYVDTNADLVADSHVVGPEGNRPIGMGGFLRADQDEVELEAESGQVVQVWELDAGGATVSQIGSATAGAGGAVSITLSRSLVAEERIGIKYASESHVQIDQVVISQIPQILRLDPQSVETNQNTTVHLYGRDFTTTMTVQLVDGAGTVHGLAASFIDSSHVTVTTPSIAAEGLVMIYAFEASEDPDMVGARGMTLLVCEPDEE
jgi:hypothetical protein